MEFTIVKCSNCGEEVTSEDLPQPLRMMFALSALMVHAAALEQLMQLPEYADIRSNWDERLEAVSANAIREAEEMQEFGESFDGTDDGENEAH